MKNSTKIESYNYEEGFKEITTDIDGIDVITILDLSKSFKGKGRYNVEIEINYENSYGIIIEMKKVFSTTDTEKIDDWNDCDVLTAELCSWAWSNLELFFQEAIEELECERKEFIDTIREEGLLDFEEEEVCEELYQATSYREMNEIIENM